MIRYTYKAVDDEGNYVRGKLAAESPAELFTMLRSTNLELISYKAERASFNLGFLRFGDRIKTKDLIATFIHLEQLDKAGVPIVDSIGDLKENADSQRVRNLMHEIHDAITSGSLFSEALAKYPNIFSGVYVGLIAAGEKTGHLAGAFTSIIEDLKWTSDFKRKTRKATLGPLFGIFIMCIVMGVMVGIVVPKVTNFLLVQDIKLPATTTSLIAFSDFITNYWLLLIVGIPGFFFGLNFLGKTFPEVGLKIDDFKLKIPVLGPIYAKLDIAKFSQFFAMTFRSGLGVIECLDSAGMVISNKAIRKSISTVKQQVSDGQSLAKAIAQTGYFPTLVTRMFKIGEDSGNMDEALQNVKFFYDREINDSIDRLVGLIQPTLTFVMGGMIMWVTVAVFGPIYGSFSRVK